MIIDFNGNLDKDFTKYLDELKQTYGEELTKLNGVSEQNLNFTGFIDNFIDNTSKVVDISINPNANSDTKDVTSLIHNMAEPHCKLLAMNKIFYEMKKKYGIDEAKRWLEGEWIGRSYLHDFPTATFVPYCYAVDLDQLVEKGLFFINKFKTQPAKHLTTFNDHCLEYNEIDGRLNDADAIKVIRKISKCKNTSEFSKLDVKIRDQYISKLKEEGLSIRQISRLTGISFGVVRRL